MSLDSIVSFFIYMVIAGLVFGLLFFLVNYIAGQFAEFAPFARFVRIALVVLFVLFLLGLLLGLAGHPVIRL